MSEKQTTYRCLIVDDEILAQDLIEQHIKKIPQFKVVGRCQSATEALSYLQNGNIDVLFLDIQMPDITGIEFLMSLSNPPLTIFTTAYSEFALKGYELNVVDYLLKPITFERFFKAVYKVLEKLNIEGGHKKTSILDFTTEAIFVKSDYKMVKVKFKDILFVEGMQKYVKFHLKDKKVISLMSLMNLEEVLPQHHFFRGHKSFIINISKIDAIAGNLVTISGNDVPVSRTLKDELINRLNNYDLL
jgi:DNA-binding LytR/AlgR family response regulator